MRTASATPPATLDAAWLRQLCLDCGADDAGLVEIGRPALDDQRGRHPAFLSAGQNAPQFRLPDEPRADPQPGPLRRQSRISPHRRRGQRGRAARSSRRWSARACAPSTRRWAFPMEMDRFPGNKIWVVSHKPVAVAAGLGMMGIHRNVIHPKFGNFILLGTVLIAAEATAYDQPIDYNPCLECKLCVAACPVGAIAPDGDFNFSACYTHNYREFMGGFTDWVETDRRQQEALDYRTQGQRSGIGLDVAKPFVRAKLQGRLLPVGLSRGRRRHRTLSDQTRRIFSRRSSVR